MPFRHETSQAYRGETKLRDKHKSNLSVSYKPSRATIFPGGFFLLKRWAMTMCRRSGFFPIKKCQLHACITSRNLCHWMAQRLMPTNLLQSHSSQHCVQCLIIPNDALFLLFRIWLLMICNHQWLHTHSYAKKKCTKGIPTTFLLYITKHKSMQYKMVKKYLVRQLQGKARVSVVVM